MSRKYPYYPIKKNHLRILEIPGVVIGKSIFTMFEWENHEMLVNVGSLMLFYVYFDPLFLHKHELVIVEI
jgi:hypothetical protein